MADKFIYTSPYKSTFDESGDLFQLLEKSFKLDPSKLALHFIPTELKITFKEAENIVNTLAQNLYQTYNFRPGDSFAIYSLNEVDIILLIMAIWKLRGIYVGINSSFKPGAVLDEVKRELMLVGCKLLYVHPQLASRISKTCQGTTVKAIFVNGGEEKDTIQYNSLLEKPAQVVSLPSTPAHPQDLCAVLFSSGTTGLPKAVQLTHVGIKHGIYTLGDPEFHDKSESMLLTKPISHIYGLLVALISISYGCSLHVLDRFDLYQYLKGISDYKVAKMMLTPPYVVLLGKSDIDPDLDLSCVKTLYVGGAPMKKSMLATVQKKLGKQVQVRQLYGLTETQGVVTLTPKSGCPYGRECIPEASVGLPVVNCQMKIIRSDDMRTLGPEEIGEICIRGLVVMKGYLNNPKGNLKAIDNDKWLHTGDVGYTDDKGYLFIVDRLTDIIKFKNNFVSPSDIEDALLGHSDIMDAGVTGIPDIEAGEVPFAWVVLQPDSSLGEADVKEWAAGTLSEQQQLRGGLKIVSAIPKSRTGKILRREIKSAVMEALQPSSSMRRNSFK